MNPSKNSQVRPRKSAKTLETSGIGVSGGGAYSVRDRKPENDKTTASVVCSVGSSAVRKNGGTKLKTIAEHAADVLNTPEFHNPHWKLNVGHIDTLHEIYDRYTEEHDLPVNNGKHPRTVLRSVTNALAYTKSGQERFRITGTINYPGIINTRCNVFELKEPYRTYDPTNEQEH